MYMNDKYNELNAVVTSRAEGQMHPNDVILDLMVSQYRLKLLQTTCSQITSKWPISLCSCCTPKSTHNNSAPTSHRSSQLQRTGSKSEAHLDATHLDVLMEIRIELSRDCQQSNPGCVRRECNEIPSHAMYFMTPPWHATNMSFPRPAFASRSLKARAITCRPAASHSIDLAGRKYAMKAEGVEWWESTLDARCLFQTETRLPNNAQEFPHWAAASLILISPPLLPLSLTHSLLVFLSIVN